MKKHHSASAHDQEEPQPPSHSTRQGKVFLIKKPTREKATKNATVAIAEPLKKNSSAKSDVQTRITERAYELYHRRGDHHGQDLKDWLTAEREVLAEGS
jgi:DUF2934 family protein